MTKTAEAMTALLEDDSVTEIMVDGPDRVYVERRGKLEDTDVRFAGEQQVIDWANSLLATHGGGPVGEGRPWAEARLRDGSRMLVVVPPVAVSGPNVVIRKFSRLPITFDQLLQWGSLGQNILDFMRVVMQTRLDVLVAGGTAAGKTALTNLIVELMPAEERLVVVERANELNIRHERLVYLEAHWASTDGTGGVDVNDLLWVAARMRPDRIIVGELMGVEVVEMLRLMNTGHEGMVATMHANSPRDALARLETMATMAEPSLTLPVIRGQIAAALDLIIHAGRLEDGSRRVLSVVEVQDLKGDNIVLQELFTWKKTGVGEDGRFTGVFEATGATPSFAPVLAAAGYTFPEGMFEGNA
jgi:pilus assembly protein CpaF